MIALVDMEKRAQSYLRAARILGRSAHAEYDTAAYLCGYAIEIALKARMCHTLGWSGWPETPQDFRFANSLKIHDLDSLLRLSGREARVRLDPGLLADWSVVRSWNPEQRYAPLGAKTVSDVKNMTDAAGRLQRALL